MPEYVLNRNHTHRSTYGHVISFQKGVPVYVPPILEREVTLFGAEPVEGERLDLLEDLPSRKDEPMGEDRRALLLAAYETLVTRNGRTDFTGQGRPHLKAVEKLVGFEITNRERDEVWEDFNARRNAQ